MLPKGLSMLQKNKKQNKNGTLSVAIAWLQLNVPKILVKLTAQNLSLRLCFILSTK